MRNPPSASSLSAIERLCCEVNSKCASLRAASRLLGGLSARDSAEMLLLMADEAFRLYQSLEKHHQDARYTALAFKLITPSL